MAFGCEHNYELVDKHEFKSPLEIAKEMGVGTTLGAAHCHAEGILEQKVVWIFKCTKCSHLHKISESV